MFITSGSSGIGLALAHKAVSEGARVSILARSLQKFEEAQKSTHLAYGVDDAILAVDVRDYDAVERAIVESGPIDVLVVNQGVFLSKGQSIGETGIGWGQVYDRREYDGEF